MNEAATGHLHPILNLVLAVGVLYLVWSVLASRARARHPGPADYRVTVYCRHCNWEGIVRRSHMSCSRCHSGNVSVLVV